MTKQKTNMCGQVGRKRPRKMFVDQIADVAKASEVVRSKWRSVVLPTPTEKGVSIHSIYVNLIFGTWQHIFILKNSNKETDFYITVIIAS